MDVKIFACEQHGSELITIRKTRNPLKSRSKCKNSSKFTHSVGRRPKKICRNSHRDLRKLILDVPKSYIKRLKVNLDMLRSYINMGIAVAVRTRKVPVTGVQIYTCGKNAPGAETCNLKVPETALFDISQKPLGTPYRARLGKVSTAARWLAP
jgi:hypothetical protein